MMTSPETGELETLKEPGEPAVGSEGSSVNVREASPLSTDPNGPCGDGGRGGIGVMVSVPVKGADKPPSSGTV